MENRMERFQVSEEELSQCVSCLHKDSSGAFCDAYPKSEWIEIPLVILMNKHDHKNPYKGDHGILFESVDK
jgi:hypothetical protein